MQDTDPSPATDQADLLAWLRLHLADGVGPMTVQHLLGRFSFPQAIFSASHAALCAAVPAALASALLAPPDRAAIEAALCWAAQPGHHLLTPGHPAFPPLLREIAAPPFLLYAIGNLDLLARPCLAVVGSRNATGQGRATAAAFAQALSQAGLTVVSGLALGIDAAAHEGALRGPASTIAVIGTGADRIYPRRNAELARRIGAEGCMVSEYPLGTPALSGNFPKRNRLISGLAAGVLVVEAAAQSGSLTTARLANDQGRDVFAIPGSIHSPLSKGCHQLIRQGAKLIDTIDDLLEDLRVAPLASMPQPAPSPAAGGGPAALGPAERAVLAALGHGPCHVDALLEASGTACATLLAALFTLEMSGQAERLPGGFFQRVTR